MVELSTNLGLPTNGNVVAIERSSSEGKISWIQTQPRTYLYSYSEESIFILDRPTLLWTKT